MTWEWWASNWGNVLAAITFPTVPIGLAIAWMSWRVKRPAYATVNTAVLSPVEDKAPALEITYRGYGESIRSLTITKLVFWNAGRQEVVRSDVVRGHEIKVVATGETVVLNATVLQTNNPANKFEISTSRDRKSVAIQFDHMNHRDGVVLKIDHTGTTTGSLVMEGAVRGVGCIHHQRTGFGYFIVWPSWISWATSIWFVSIYAWTFEKGVNQPNFDPANVHHWIDVVAQFFSQRPPWPSRSGLYGRSSTTASRNR